MKIDLPGSSSLGLDAFADFYRYPSDRSLPSPLLVWIGGAISDDEYHRRRTEEPRAVLAELERARARVGDPPIDALILSNPPTLREAADRLPRFERFFFDELLPLVPSAGPRGVGLVGLVGNSLGAHFAYGIACRLPEVRAVATIAGVGMWAAVEAAGGAGGKLRDDLALRCFVNDQDFAKHYADGLAAALRSRGRTLDRIDRTGGHPFADYAANGSVEDALAFVLESLRGR